MTHQAVAFALGRLGQPVRVLLVPAKEREFFIDNLLVRIHYIIVMIKWTGLAPWEFEFPIFVPAKRNWSNFDDPSHLQHPLKCPQMMFLWGDLEMCL